MVPVVRGSIACYSNSKHCKRKTRRSLFCSNRSEKELACLPACLFFQIWGRSWVVVLVPLAVIVLLWWSPLSEGRFLERSMALCWASSYTWEKLDKLWGTQPPFGSEGSQLGCFIACLFIPVLPVDLIKGIASPWKLCCAYIHTP